MNSFFGSVGMVFGRRPILNTLIQTRNKMKTNKSAAKRLVQISSGYVRKQAGRNHGNGNFSASSLKHLDGWVPVTKKGGHLKKIKTVLGG
ncbi:hypothetical protein PUMCH_004482 [Australozyma saopauloensis]|uniref:50S ribosomal protein L35 n=1 Tax=Australozyma saopauloensis TaxID=291208 RepID=A0AAX4HFG4_9ASCO|nr:hypothetical protein PUMCH_004482 [[Candida] saopauloensis]